MVIDFTLHAGNKIYEGGDNGTLLGFYSTSSSILSEDVQLGLIVIHSSNFAKSINNSSRKYI
jgi:hypothetical protein